MIGIRVPVLPDGVADLANAVGGLLATSANLRGGADPATLEEVPAKLSRQAAGFEIDGGRAARGAVGRDRCERHRAGGGPRRPGQRERSYAV